MLTLSPRLPGQPCLQVFCCQTLILKWCSENTEWDLGIIYVDNWSPNSRYLALYIGPQLNNKYCKNPWNSDYLILFLLSFLVLTIWAVVLQTGTFSSQSCWGVGKILGSFGPERLAGPSLVLKGRFYSSVHGSVSLQTKKQRCCLPPRTSSFNCSMNASDWSRCGYMSPIRILSPTWVKSISSECTSNKTLPVKNVCAFHTVWYKQLYLSTIHLLQAWLFKLFQPWD